MAWGDLVRDCRLHRRILLASISTVVGSVVALGCGPYVESAFRPSDRTFTPRRGRTPPVYLYYSSEVPTVRMRSVGIVAVSVPARSGLDGVIHAAAAKGRDVGCWALVEESLFAQLASRALTSQVGALPILVHGGGFNGPRRVSIPPPRDRSVVAAEFECAFRHDGPRRVDRRRRWRQAGLMASAR